MPKSNPISTSQSNSHHPTINSSTLNLRTAIRWKLYLPLWLLLNAIVWLPALLYIKLTPLTYTSGWTVAINSSSSSTKVSLPGIGEANSSTNSPFGSHLADPREVYKFLIGTDEVLTNASQILSLSVREFGKPRIKILDNSTLMQLEIEGRTPEVAREKAFALQTALEAKLKQIRYEEINQRRRNAQESLIPMEKKLQDAQRRLYEYKAGSSLTSVEQLRDLSTNLEELRRKRAEATANFQQASSKVRQLSGTLGLSAEQATDALTLRSDRVFQEYLSKYSQVSTELISATSRFTSSNPVVVDKRREKETLFAAMLQQSQNLLGRPVSNAILQALILSGTGSSDLSGERANLFQNLVSLQAEQKGMQAQTQELNQQIAQLEARLSRLSQEEAKLDSLQRDTKIAEATFSSSSTKQDLDQTDTSASYPPMSILAQPSLPEKPSQPKSKFALLGAGIGSVLMTLGILALWIREQRRQRIQILKGNALEEHTPRYNSNSDSNHG